MRVAYFDCFSGISGEMILGALLDAGLPVDALRNELARLPLRGYTLEEQKVTREGITGTLLAVFDYSSPGGRFPGWARSNEPPRLRANDPAPAGYGSYGLYGEQSQANGSYNGYGLGGGAGGVANGPIPLIGKAAASTGPRATELVDAVAESTLDEDVKERAIAAISVLAHAEAAVHGTDPSQVHLPGVSTVCTLVDIVGAIMGLRLLGIERVECSPLNIGGGFVRTEHGTLPVPAPGTAEVLRSASIPIYGTEVNRELVTSTGAAIMAAVCGGFGPMPSITVDKIGYGAGKADSPGLPNLVRLTIGDLVARPVAASPQHAAQPYSQAPAGDKAGHQPTPDEEWVSLIETNLDDMNPQYYDFVMERLLGQGALDVYLVPVQMKKNRPGVVLSVLCKPESVDLVSQIIFEETSTGGLRITDMPRRVLQRDVTQVNTLHGPVQMKIARSSDGRVLHVKPEYEDVKRIALENNLPIDKVYEEARKAYAPHPQEGHQRVGRHRALPAASGE